MLAICPTCSGKIEIGVAAVHTGTDYAGGEPVHNVTLRGVYRHNCPGPEPTPTSPPELES
jgi:hypothetical protein